MATGDAGISDLLDELERVLVDLAASPETLSAEQLSEVRHRIEARSLLFKVRSCICRCPAATEIHRAKRERDPARRSRPAEERSHEEDILDSVRHRAGGGAGCGARGAKRSTPCRCPGGRRQAPRRAVGRTHTGGQPRRRRCQRASRRCRSAARSASRWQSVRCTSRQCRRCRRCRPWHRWHRWRPMADARCCRCRQWHRWPWASRTRGRTARPSARTASAIRGSVRCSARSRSAIASHRSTSRATARCMKGAGIAP